MYFFTCCWDRPGRNHRGATHSTCLFDAKLRPSRNRRRACRTGNVVSVRRAHAALHDFHRPRIGAGRALWRTAVGDAAGTVSVMNTMMKIPDSAPLDAWTSGRLHILKSWPEFFAAIVAGERMHELRENDRGYAVGDALLLEEFDPARGAHTGAACLVRVTSMTSREVPCAVSSGGLSDSYCILSVRLLAAVTDREAAPSAETGVPVTR